MNSEKDKNDQLMAAYLSGNCHDSEKKEFERWLSLSEENQRLYNISKKIWDYCPKAISDPQLETAKKSVFNELITKLTKKSLTLSFFYTFFALLAFTIIWVMGCSFDSDELFFSDLGLVNSLFY